MGIDITRLINHQLNYTTPQEFIVKLKDATGYDTFVSRISIKNTEIEEISAPDDFTGWETYLEDNDTLEKRELDDTSMLEYYLRDNTKNEICLYANPSCFELTGNPFYMGRWFEVKYICDYIKNNGIPRKEDYEHKKLIYNLHHRKKLFEYAQQFGTTAMIMFCDDMHQDWLDKFFDGKWTFEQFIEWGKNEFQFVEFHNLPNFDFPEKQPDYYNVFIYDDFRDLK